MVIIVIIRKKQDSEERLQEMKARRDAKKNKTYRKPQSRPVYSLSRRLNRVKIDDKPTAEEKPEEEKPAEEKPAEEKPAEEKPAEEKPADDWMKSNLKGQDWRTTAEDVRKKRNKGECANCGAPSRHRCGRCRSVYYCSNECIKSNWNIHMAQCID